MFTLDPTGFPVVRVPAATLDVGLLPVTRAQFDFFLGDRTGVDPTTLAEMTQIAPRGTWRTIPADRPESVFLTAVRPEEAEAFARWLGDGFRLPTDGEWRAIDAHFGRLPDCHGLHTLIDEPQTHPAAKAVLAWGLGRAPATWRTGTLFEDGILEWVRRPAGFGLQGRPRPALFRVVQNPQVHAAIQWRSDARHRAFGFRVVRPLLTTTPVPR